MNLTTKGDLVLAALRKLGVASDATLTDVEPQSMEDGVNDLEMMMAEWLGGDDSPGISVGYIFADAEVAPSPGDEHGLSNNALNAVVPARKRPVIFAAIVKIVLGRDGG